MELPTGIDLKYLLQFCWCVIFCTCATFFEIMYLIFVTFKTNETLYLFKSQIFLTVLVFHEDDQIQNQLVSHSKESRLSCSPFLDRKAAASFPTSMEMKVVRKRKKKSWLSSDCMDFPTDDTLHAIIFFRRFKVMTVFFTLPLTPQAPPMIAIRIIACKSTLD